MKVPNFMHKAMPLKSWWQPFPLFMATIVLIVIVYWFGLALIEIHPWQAGPIFRTGGWFYLGFPFILGFAMACACAVTLVARRTSRMWVWVTILPLSVFLAYAGGTRDFPAHRLPVILGIDPTATNVIEYRVIDSFNDGDMIVGTLSISPAEFASIVKNRDLSPQSDMSRPALAQDRYPDGLPTAWNEQLTVWYDAVDRRLFFRYHSRQNRGGRQD